MKIVTVVGARPQFIKAAPVSEALRKTNTEILVHTGQHFDENMSAVFFNELSIPKPDYNLNINGGSHGRMTGRMLEGIEEILFSEKPDALLVYGDTNSTLAGALAASKLLIPVIHVEAGLRSYNRAMPEEQNRILTDHISTVLSCPTETAVKNLAAEGIISGVYNTGDVMLDAVLRNITLAHIKHPFEQYVGGFTPIDETTAKNIMSIEPGKYILATVHRAENTNDPEKLRTIFGAFGKLGKPVVLPLHPRTRTLIKDFSLPENLLLIEPVGYLEMLTLTENAAVTMTDSGGLQKEAFFLETPCVTLRDQTEWVETLSGGWNVLADIDEDKIVSLVNKQLTVIHGNRPSCFGDGNASRAVAALADKLF